jgi:hypothetical protein
MLLINEISQIGKTVKKQLTGRIPLRRRRSALGCSGIEREEEPRRSSRDRLKGQTE